MEQTGQAQTQPKPRRRRGLIVALLALASMVSWWYWPRGDARLVGTWRATYRNDPTTTVVTFHANGTGILTVSAGATARFPWRLEGNRLLLGYAPNGSFLKTARWLNDQLAWLTGASIMLEEEAAEVLEMTPTGIRMRDSASRTMGEATLTRLSE
ncbi:MAG TPA: hypothetical protein VM452_11640 [Caulifigura sp.]|nr:hypothetical protein [Caulifigura sp.]